MAQMIAADRLELTRGAFSLRVSFELARGRRLGLVGPSGAGKSTLLDLISGFAEPDSGRVLIDGQDMAGKGPAERPVSILFQDGNLFPHLDVQGNVGLGLRTDLKLSAEERDRVAESLAHVGMADFARAMPATLSGGQQARVALARILLRDRPVLLVDEPFSALDPRLRFEMAELLDRVCAERGLTVVMVTHDLRGTDTLLTDLALMENGRLSLLADAVDLRSDPPDALKPWL